MIIYIDIPLSRKVSIKENDVFLKELAKPETVSENTHFNKDGAMLITKGLVELIRESKNHQLGELQSSLLHNVV